MEELEPVLDGDWLSLRPLLDVPASTSRTHCERHFGGGNFALPFVSIAEHE